MIIKTKQFTLRPATLKDAEGYYECHQDAEAKKAFRSVPASVEEARKEIRENLAKARKGLNEMFTIDVKGEMAGFVNLKYTDIETYKHSVVIGYGIHRKFRGKGITTAAVKKVTAYVLKKPGIRRICGYCRAHNKASARVLEKAGYQLEGTLRKSKFMNGKYVDDQIWARVR